MKVKRYVGSTVEDALRRVKEEMGSNAIILHQRKIKPGTGMARLFKKSIFEVIAAIDRSEQEMIKHQYPVRNNTIGMEERFEELKIGLNTILDRITKEEQQVHDEDGIPAALLYYYRLMKDNEVSADIINSIIKNVQTGLNPDNDYEEEYLYFKFKKEISSYFEHVRTIELENGRPNVVAFVGPTGVGKTTTLAKLAAQYSQMKKKKVGVITCDTYRIAAIDQLKTYCEIMDIPVKVIYQSKDIQEVVEEYKNKDLILVDTAGRGHSDKMRLMELNNLLKDFGKLQTFLVISATTNHKNCLAIIDSYSFLDDYSILITKIDECVVKGILLNLAGNRNRPLSYITTGQNVPDDIQKVDGERLASLLLSQHESELGV